jgi:hypothetical protein
MSGERQSAETAVLGRVDFTCQWCGGQFAYQPNLMGSGLGVQVNVNRIGMRCVSHTARIVDLRTTPGPGAYQ